MSERWWKNHKNKDYQNERDFYKSETFRYIILVSLSIVIYVYMKDQILINLIYLGLKINE